MYRQNRCSTIKVVEHPMAHSSHTSAGRESLTLPRVRLRRDSVEDALTG